jgi:hypothetical protein
MAALAAALLWLPISAWIMPKFFNAPHLIENPNWYLSSMMMGVVVVYLVRWLLVINQR